MLKKFLVATLLILCACHSPPPRQNIVRINIGSEPQTLDPRKARSLNDVNTLKLLFEGLTEIDKQGMPQLAAAEKYVLSGDGLCYTFTLRNTHWSNGDPVVASDFISAWQTTLDPNFPSDTAHGLYAIKNAQKIKEQGMAKTELGVKALDDHTLEIHLEKATPHFLGILAGSVYFPIHPSNNPSIANGPFHLTDWQHLDHIDMKKNTHYWDEETISIAGIKMFMLSEDTALRMFENDELDWHGSPFSTIPIDAIPKLKKKLKRAPFLGTYWLRLNTSKPPFDQHSFRKSLSLALDRNALVTHITYATQTDSTCVVPKSLGLQTNALSENLNEAKKLLSKIHLPAKPITLLYAAGDRGHKMAQGIQSQWKSRLGIEIQLEAVESKIYFDRISKCDYEISIGSWMSDFADPIYFLNVFKTKGNGINNTGWENPTYQKLLDESSDHANRRHLLCKAEEILLDQVPVIPIFHYNMLYLQNEKLKNVKLSPMGSLNFKQAYLEE